MSLTAEPTPAFRSGSDAMIPVVDGAMVSPIPAAMITMATTRCQYGVSTADWASSSNPSPRIRRPVETTFRFPNFSTNLALDGAATIIVNGIGSIRTPASRVPYPSTIWRYWVSRKNVPNMAKNTRLMAAVADANVGFLKKRRSSIGCSARNSQTLKATRTARPETIDPTVAPAVQPWAGPSMIP